MTHDHYDHIPLYHGRYTDSDGGETFDGCDVITEDGTTYAYYYPEEDTYQYLYQTFPEVSITSQTMFLSTKSLLFESSSRAMNEANGLWCCLCRVRLPLCSSEGAVAAVHKRTSL